MAKSKQKKAAKSAKDEEERLENLHRFAGSSAEEDSDDDNVDHSEDEEDDEDEAVAMNDDDRNDEPADDEDNKEDNGGIESAKLDRRKKATTNNPDEDSSDDEEGDSQKAPGMANAMARILGTTASGRRGTKPVVLSKTTTRIQKQAAQEKVRVKEMKEKRLVNREKELQALHIPLSVATSHQVADTSKALVKELEMERVHRRVATRGVVALFNAIAQHQNKEIKESSTLMSSSKKDVKKMSKHGFLDMLKNKATATDATSSPAQDTKDEPQWKALQDDYMLNPKKNWDEESSDDEEDGDDGPPEQGRDAKGKKKRKRTAVRFK
jgi:hypothetical protein